MTSGPIVHQFCEQRNKNKLRDDEFHGGSHFDGFFVLPVHYLSEGRFQGMLGGIMELILPAMVITLAKEGFKACLESF